MNQLSELISKYDDRAALEDAFTIPASWYTNPEMLDLELRAVFGRTWQMIGRTGQVASPGDYITAQVGNEPVLAVRGADRPWERFSMCAGIMPLPLLSNRAEDRSRSAVHTMAGPMDWMGG